MFLLALVSTLLYNAAAEALNGAAKSVFAFYLDVDTD